MKDTQVNEILSLIEEAEKALKKSKMLMTSDSQKISGATTKEAPSQEASTEGVFMGDYVLLSTGNKLKIAESYAARTNLVVGDILVLESREGEQGRFNLKERVQRTSAKATYTSKGGQPIAKIGAKEYKVPQISVEHFNLKEGDAITILLPVAGQTNYAPIESKINVSVKEAVSPPKEPSSAPAGEKRGAEKMVDEPQVVNSDDPGRVLEYYDLR